MLRVRRLLTHGLLFRDARLAVSSRAGFKMKKIIFIIVAIFVLIGLLCLGYAYFIEPFQLAVNHSEIKIKNWNPAFDNFKIVLISDVHGGSRGVTAEKIQQVVAAANAENPDLIVLLGDYVSQQFGNRRELKMPMTEIADNLAGLKAANGVYAVLGNHDGEYDDKIVKRELERVGYKVLVNEIAEIKRNDQTLRILGLQDHLKIGNWEAFSKTIKSIIERNNGKGDILVLEHSPDILPIITGKLSISPDLKLILAGHTHGGQVRFPLVGSLIVPSNYGQKYALGHILENDVDMFVTTGIGTSVLPLRFGVPPEIHVLTVKSE